MKARIFSNQFLNGLFSTLLDILFHQVAIESGEKKSILSVIILFLGLLIFLCNSLYHVSLNFESLKVKLIFFILPSILFTLLALLGFEKEYLDESSLISAIIVMAVLNLLFSVRSYYKIFDVKK